MLFICNLVFNISTSFVNWKTEWESEGKSIGSLYNIHPNWNLKSGNNDFNWLDILLISFFAEVIEVPIDSVPQS